MTPTASATVWNSLSMFYTSSPRKLLCTVGSGLKIPEHGHPGCKMSAGLSDGHGLLELLLTRLQSVCSSFNLKAIGSGF